MSRARIILLVLLVATTLGAVYVFLQSSFRAEEVGSYQTQPLQFDQSSDEFADPLPSFNLENEFY